MQRASTPPLGAAAMEEGAAARISDLHAGAASRYDVRCHKFISFKASGEDFHARREDLPLPAALGMKITPLLSPKECDDLVASAHRWGFESVAWEYDKAYRDCTRVVVMAPDLADVLWQRVLLSFKPADLMTGDDPTGGCRPVGFGCDGVWRPVGVNPCIRFSRYETGGHFEPHRDSAFVVTDDRRSVLTVMAYLTDGFEGGDTTFFAEGERISTGLPAPGPPVHRVVPMRGDGLVFSHSAWHAGEPVHCGTKIILRTDVIFERAPCSSVPRGMSYTTHPGYLEAERLFRESIELQSGGDPHGSTSAFIRALELHATVPASAGTPASAAAAPAPLAPTSPALFFGADAPLGATTGSADEAGTLPENVLAAVLEHLGPGGVCAIARTSKAWRAATNTSECWLSFYRQQFGDEAVTRAAEASALAPPKPPSGPRGHGRQATGDEYDSSDDNWFLPPTKAKHGATSPYSADAHPIATLPLPPISSAARAALLLSRDWKRTYREAHEARLARRVLVADIGFDSTKFQMANDELVDFDALIRDAVGEEEEGQGWRRDRDYRVSLLLRRPNRLRHAIGLKPSRSKGPHPMPHEEAKEQAKQGPLGGMALRRPLAVPSIVGRVAGHYWSAGQGIAQFMVGHECLDEADESRHWGAAFAGRRGGRRQSYLRHRVWMLEEGAPAVDTSASGATAVEIAAISEAVAATDARPIEDSGPAADAAPAAEAVNTAKVWQMDVNDVSILLHWLMRHAFAKALSPNATPLLLAVPATMPRAARDHLACSIANTRERMRPALSGSSALLFDYERDDFHPAYHHGNVAMFAKVSLVDSACLALRAAQRTTGVVVDAGARRIEVALVRDGNVRAAVDVPLEHAVRCLVIEKGEADADAATSDAPCAEAKAKATGASMAARMYSTVAQRLHRGLSSVASAASAASAPTEDTPEVAAVTKQTAAVCLTIREILEADMASSGDEALAALESVLLIGGNSMPLQHGLHRGLVAFRAEWPAVRARRMALLVPLTSDDARLATVRGAQLTAGAHVALSMESCTGEAESSRRPLPPWIEQWTCESEVMAVV